MPLAGDPILSSDLPYRVGTTDLTAAGTGTSSSTQVVAASVTVSLTAGRTYTIGTYLRIQVSASGAVAVGRIREDSTSGAEMAAGRVGFWDSTSAASSLSLTADYTATATGSKTFVATVGLNAGTGTVTPTGSATAPSKLWVDAKSA